MAKHLYMAVSTSIHSTIFVETGKLLQDVLIIDQQHDSTDHEEPPVVVMAFKIPVSCVYTKLYQCLTSQQVLLCLCEMNLLQAFLIHTANPVIGD